MCKLRLKIERAYHPSSFNEYGVMNTIDQIEVDISVELGAAIIPVHHMLRMGRGAVIELDTTDTSPMRIFANNQLIAMGEIRIDEGQLNIEVIEKVLKPK